MMNIYKYTYEMQSIILLISFEIICYKILVYNVIPCFGLPYEYLSI